MTDEITQTTRHIHRSERLWRLTLHALFIGIIFVLPEALLRVAIPQRTLIIPWPMYAKSAITVGVFYLNYFIVIPRTITLQENRKWHFFGWNLLIIVVGAFLIWFIYRVLYHSPSTPEVKAPLLASFSYLLRDAIMLVLAISLAVAMRVASRWNDLEKRHQRLMTARRQSELESLRSQLNPHFLFNILNSIYALIEISPADAQKAIHRLSALLRYVVYDNPKTVPLSREIEFVTNYVELMKIRMGTRPIRLNVEIAPEDADAEIAPLLIVTIIENSFKHGNTEDPSNPIVINISARNGQIYCSTENHTITPDTVGGVGLANLRRRLELLYGADASLQTSITPDGVFLAWLSVPAKLSDRLPV